MTRKKGIECRKHNKSTEKGQMKKKTIFFHHLKWFLSSFFSSFFCQCVCVCVYMLLVIKNKTQKIGQSACDRPFERIKHVLLQKHAIMRLSWYEKETKCQNDKVPHTLNMYAREQPDANDWVFMYVCIYLRILFLNARCVMPVVWHDVQVCVCVPLICSKCDWFSFHCAYTEPSYRKHKGMNEYPLDNTPWHAIWYVLSHGWTMIWVHVL